MGCGGSKQTDEPKKPAKGKPEYKLLLLGTGNSGKSTFFKQLTQLHGGGFMEDEYTQGIKHIHDSILAQMKNLLTSCTEEMGIEFDNKLQESANIIQELSPHASIEDVKSHLITLWNDANVKRGFDERTNLGVADSASYFFDNIDRIASTNYRPTDKDILLARIPTTGMRKKKFELNKNIFNIYDVGGQRAERQKWIHSFQIVHGILFVASLSCYDQTLYEDNKLNAMHESLNLFSEIINSRYFKLTTIMLFLNKNDLFIDELMKGASLSVCFNNDKWNGPNWDKNNDYNPNKYQNNDDIKEAKVYFENCYEKALEFIRQRYQDQCLKKPKLIHFHTTTATDRDIVKKVFWDIQHIILRGTLENAGMIEFQ
mmetsp:Transcript_105935/g.129226  ORF Transcript_105935/g.129226 Transcript_105935/m.129226 type:complete len:371 (+) Transcript_105935:77-1189(+)